VKSISTIPPNSKTLSPECGQTVVDLKYFSRDVPPYFVLRCAKDSSKAPVSVQVILEVFQDQTYVMNRSWKKAETDQEWAKSIDFAWFSSQFLQTWAVGEFQRWKLVAPWTFPDRKIKFSKDLTSLKRKIDAFEKLFGLILANPDGVRDSFRPYLLVMVFYGGALFFETLYKSLASASLDAGFLDVPPFAVFDAGRSKPPVTPGLAPIVLESTQYEKLRTAIHAFRCDLLLLDPIK
jgi:hypothetical protein